METINVKINGKWDLKLPAHRQLLDWDNWEKERLASMHEHLKKGDIIFDIGAEEGDLTALWQTWGCHPVAFEPGLRIWPNIKTVWDLNKLQPMIAWFVGFASDETQLDPPHFDSRLAEDVDGWPMAAYENPVTEESDFRHLAQQATELPRITIDDFVATTSITPDAITMDVEGSELRVLHGAKRTLVSNNTKVWVSVHTDRAWVDQWYGGFTSETVKQFMESIGYKSEFLVEDHEEHWFFHR